MTQQEPSIRNTYATSFRRWSVLCLVSFTMLTGYVMIDVMAPLKTLFEQQMGWDSVDYGIFTSGYGWFNIFLLMLVFGGIILDKRGIRFTGTLAAGLMIAGALLKYWAISTEWSNAITSLTLGGHTLFALKSQILYTTLGYALFGVGCEMFGIVANKIVIKWFQGRSLALALGLNLAAGRIGTAIAMFGSLPLACIMGDPTAPIALCTALLCIGFLAYLIFCVMDRRYDRAQNTNTQPDSSETMEPPFKISDIVRIVRIRAFWYITILCLLFYSGIFPFLKFATELMIQKFAISPEFAGAVPALLPFGNILLTPLFGSIYDHKGYGITLMWIGSGILTIVYLIFAIPALTAKWIAVILILLLGIAFSMVPAAMWPSVSKIIPYRMVGTSFSLIFWIQNWGLSFVPLLIGFVLQKYCIIGTTVVDGLDATRYDYTLPMLIFAVFGLLSIGFAFLLKKEDKRKQYGLEHANFTDHPHV